MTIKRKNAIFKEMLFKSKITNGDRPDRVVSKTWVYADCVGVTDSAVEAVAIKRYLLL